MGLTGKGAGSFIAQLETGRIRRPYLDTIVKFLRVCGARVSTFAEQFDRIEPVPLDEPVAKIVSQAWQNGRNLPGRKPGVSAEDAKERVAEKAASDAQKFRQHSAYPIKGAPPTEEKSRSGTAKLREFYVQLNIVKEDIASYLIEVERGLADQVWFNRLGSKLLAAFRRFPEPALRARLDEISAWARQIGLRPALVSDVRRIVETRWLVSFAPPGTPRPQDRAFCQMELELKTAFQRRELYEQAARMVIPRLDPAARQQSRSYCKLALEFYRAWIQAMLEPVGECARRRDQAFDVVEQQAVQRGLAPGLVRAVRQLCAEGLVV
jgi:hypothetical protein